MMTSVYKSSENTTSIKNYTGESRNEKVDLSNVICNIFKEGPRTKTANLDRNYNGQPFLKSNDAANETFHRKHVLSEMNDNKTGNMFSYTETSGFNEYAVRQPASIN